MKDAILIVGGITFFAIMLGFVLPFLISAKSTFAVLGAAFIIALVVAYAISRFITKKG